MEWSDCGYYKRRVYDNYDDYLEHQKSKLDKGIAWLLNHEQSYGESLTRRMKALKITGRTVLCLGARLGAEVRAFINCNNLAIGIDVNPGPKNKTVLYGDFHDIQFAGSSFDIVFTNALDHAYDIDKMLCEVRRVIRPGGLFMWECLNPLTTEAFVSCSIAESGGDEYESVSYIDAKAFDDHVCRAGFSVLKQLYLKIITRDCGDYGGVCKIYKATTNHLENEEGH